jgi:hypothetical protein
MFFLCQFLTFALASVLRKKKKLCILAQSKEAKRKLTIIFDFSFSLLCFLRFRGAAAKERLQRSKSKFCASSE